MPRVPVGPISLQRHRAGSLQSQLAAELRDRIRSGGLRPGQAVPSSRVLAAELGVSRNTVVAACDQLTGEGYLEPRARSGLYVSALLPETATPAPDAGPPPASPRKPARLAGPPPFVPCQPDVRLFPLALWNRLRARALRRYGSAILHYQSAQCTLALPALQQALAQYLRDSRGVQCRPEQIAVTTGSQQALFLLAHLLLRRGSPAFVEDPGYLGAKSAFLAAGADLRFQPVDGDGVIPPPRIPAGAVMYTTPSRQFPTCAFLPAARRMKLLAASEPGSWIIEDDYDSEFRYSLPPLPSLHSLDRWGRVIFIGSMSKLLFPSLRLGYVVLPPALVEPFAAMRTVADDHGPLIEQATLAEFIASGALYSHLRRCRKEYASRLDAFLSAVDTLEIPLRFPHTDGGMNLFGIPANDDDRQLSDRLTAAAIIVRSAAAYSTANRTPGLLFGFTAYAPHTIRHHLRRAAPLFRP